MLPKTAKDTKDSQSRLDFFLMYPGVEKQSGSMGSIVWQGREYPSGVLLPENVV